MTSEKLAAIAANMEIRVVEIRFEHGPDGLARVQILTEKGRKRRYCVGVGQDALEALAEATAQVEKVYSE